MGASQPNRRILSDGSPHKGPRVRIEPASDQTPGTPPGQEKGKGYERAAIERRCGAATGGRDPCEDRGGGRSTEREPGAQASDLEEARQERRKAIQEAREFLRRQAPQS